MTNRWKASCSKICSAVLFAGLIILVLGLYYAVIKAGIPYQDPTAEMQIQYAINYGIGSILLKMGAALALIGGIVRLVLWQVNKQ